MSSTYDDEAVARHINRLREREREYAQAIAAAGWLIDYLDNQTVDGEVAERIREWLENPIVKRALEEVGGDA